MIVLRWTVAKTASPAIHADALTVLDAIRTPKETLGNRLESKLKQEEGAFG